MLPFHYRQGSRQLDFNALDSLTGTLVRSKVYLAKITGFGITHVASYTQAGGFRKWVRWGYLRTAQRDYRVSPKLIKAWQRVWRWQLVGKRLHRGRKPGPSGRLYRAVDWEFAVIATTRRGGKWPRKWRLGAPPYHLELPIDYGEVVKKEEGGELVSA